VSLTNELDKKTGIYSALPEGQLQGMQMENTKKLQKGLPSSLIELLAINKAIETKNSYKNDIMLKLQGDPNSVKNKKANQLVEMEREELGLGPSQRDVAMGLANALQNKNAKANKNMQAMAKLDPRMIKALAQQRGGLGAVPRKPMNLAAGGLVPGYYIGGAIGPILSGIGTIGRSLLQPLATSSKLLKPKLPPKPTGTSLVPYNRSKVGPYLGAKRTYETPLGLGLMTLPFGFMGGIPDKPEEQETQKKTTPVIKQPTPKTPEGVPEKESRGDALDRLKYVFSTPGGFQNLARAGQQYAQKQLKNELAEKKLNIDSETAKAAAKLANVKQQSLDASKLLASMSTIQNQINEITKDVMDSTLAQTYNTNIEKLRQDPDNESLRAEVQSQEAMLEAAILNRVEAFQKEQGGENLFAQLRAIQRILYAGDIDRSQPAKVVQS
jgi:hypothetical protein